MILVVFLTMVVSQTLPIAAEDDYSSEMELMQDLLRRKMECENQHVNVTSVPPYGSEETTCSVEFDVYICWPRSKAGEVIVMPCPEFIDHYRLSEASRECYPNGTWSELDPEETYFSGRVCFCTHCKPILIINMLGYSTSLLACIVASFIFLISRSLWCTRNIIHWHLITSFILKYIIFIISAVVGSEYIWVSRIMDTMFWYAEMTNYFWMFVEGLFLHTLVVFALKIDADKINFFVYCFIGWGQPLVFVSIWATINKIKYPPDSPFIASSDSVPPHEYACIIGPTLLVLLVNCIFLLNIVRVLMSKLRDVGGMGGSGGDLEQYRRAAKSTLVLVVLLGVTYVIFICLPFLEERLSTTGRMIFVYINALLASTQGLAVATIYVFCNREVRVVLRRKCRGSGINMPCCRRRRGLSNRQSSFCKYDQTTMSTVMSVSTADAWESSPVAKRPNGNRGSKELPIPEHSSESDGEKKETIEMTTVKLNNSGNNLQGIRSEELASKDEVQPLLKSGTNNRTGNINSPVTVIQ